MANKWHTVEEDLKNKELFLKNLELKNPIVFNTYKILSPYYNSKSKIKVQCPNDHRIWEVTPHDLLKGRHCPMCNISKGEDTIKNIVESMGLEYHTQFSFPDLVTNLFVLDMMDIFQNINFSLNIMGNIITHLYQSIIVMG